ncbi:MAG: hypothetical protein ACJAUP_001970 [Cellvibrionaceae bacterium]|jgi:hypothetical protein
MPSIPNSYKKPVTIGSSLEVRGDEQDKFWFRSDRFFNADNQWYFTTRENRDVGPYFSREEAEHGLELFIDCVEKQQAGVEYAVSIAQHGDWAVAMFH